MGIFFRQVMKEEIIDVKKTMLASVPGDSKSSKASGLMIPSASEVYAQLVSPWYQIVGECILQMSKQHLSQAKSKRESYISKTSKRSHQPLTFGSKESVFMA